MFAVFYTFVRYEHCRCLFGPPTSYSTSYYSVFPLFFALCFLDLPHPIPHPIRLPSLAVVLSPSFPLPSHFQLNCDCPECKVFMKRTIQVQRATEKIRKAKDERLHARVHEVEVELVSWNCLCEPRYDTILYSPTATRTKTTG
jgi:hypothetical protein